MLSRRSFLAMPSAAPLGLGHAPAVDSCPQFFSPLPVTASAPPLIASATPSATVSALPRLGLGTCCDEPEEAREQVLGALDAGYRLIDTAAHYPSEMAVGDAIATAFESGTLRSKEDLTVCTKIWFDEMGYEPALASIQRSLHRLRLDKLGVLLIHFPGAPDAVQDPKRNRRLREGAGGGAHETDRSEQLEPEAFKGDSRQLSAPTSDPPDGNPPAAPAKNAP